MTSPPTNPHKTAARLKRLNRHYAALERRWTSEESTRYENYVVPNGNSQAPVHRWFHMKEAFSDQLLSLVVHDVGLTNRPHLSVLDPYCGTGTTGVALAGMVRGRALASARFLGVEANPFLQLAASAKMDAIVSPPRHFRRTAGQIAAEALRETGRRKDAPLLSTFHRSDYFPVANLQELLKLRAAAKRILESEEPSLSNLVRLCLGASIEASTYLRRDGRALRFEPTKKIRRPIDEFLRRVSMIEEDLPLEGARVNSNIVLGDARKTDPYRGATKKVDLCLFSPPYPNNIDYTEVYKLEAWLLGLIESEEAFADQRRRTVRSHPSLKFADAYEYSKGSHADEMDALLEPILNAVPPEDRYTAARRRVVRGYADDLLVSLMHVRKLMKGRASLVYVVGNSVHGAGAGAFVIASDLIIARLAELAGFSVERLEIARRPRRRGHASPYLRETVVFTRARNDLPQSGRRKAI